MPNLPLPRNARPIVEARMRGEGPSAPLLVSYVGSLPFRGPTVYCDSGRHYDWRFATSMFVWIFVAPDIDASDAIRGLFPVARPCITLQDVTDTRIVGCVMSIDPLRIVRQTADRSPWHEMTTTPRRLAGTAT